MVKTKITPIILMALGALVILMNFIPTLANAIPFTENLTTMHIYIIGGSLIIVGFLLMKGKKVKKYIEKEIPIYKGKSKEVIAYRRE